MKPFLDSLRWFVTLSVVAGVMLVSSIAAADPFSETESFTASPAEAVDIFGDRVVIGRSNSAGVYVRAGEDWVLEDTLTPPGGLSGVGFGDTVAMWDDVIVVGAPGTTSGLSVRCGSVFVYRRSGSSWPLEQRIDILGCSTGEWPDFGKSVDVVGDVLIVGAPGEFSGFSSVKTGSAKTYRFNSGTWFSNETLVGSTAGVGDSCGADVGLSAGRAVFWCSGEGATGTFYSYDDTGSSWTNEVKHILPSSMQGGFDLWSNRLVTTLSSGGIATFSFDGSAWSFGGFVCDAYPFTNTDSCEDASRVSLSGSLLTFDTRLNVGLGLTVTNGIFRVGSEIDAFSFVQRQQFGLSSFPDRPSITVGWNGARCEVEATGCPAGVPLDDRIVRVLADSFGFDLLILEPIQCNDGIDNDHDGIVDTGDGDCVDSRDRTEWSLSPGDAIALDHELASAVRIRPTSGQTTTLFAGGLLTLPADLVVGAGPNLFAIDGFTRSLLRFDPATGKQLLVSSQGNLVAAESVDIEANGDLLVADVATDTVIRVVEATGAQTLLLPAETYANAHGLAVASDGTLLVTDNRVNTTATISTLHPVTAAETVIATGLDEPLDGAIDAGGRFVFVEGADSTPATEVLAVDPAFPGATPLLISNDPLLSNLKGVSIEANGMILAADRDDGLYRIDPNLGPSANATLLAGGNFESVSVFLPECGDRFDNDLDGAIDVGDLDCTLATDESESLVRIGAIEKLSNKSGYLSGPGTPGTNPGSYVLEGDLFGSAVESIGDIDGDGIGDIAVGSRGDDDGANEGGAFHILLLNADASVKSASKFTATTGGLAGALSTAGLPPLASGQLGSGIAHLGDLDGIGGSDFALAVGAFGDNGAGGNPRGAVYIFFMSASPVAIDSVVKIGDGIGGFPSGQLADFDFFGGDIATIGDVNGDGVVDLAVGATVDDTQAPSGGAVWVLFLSTSGTALASPAPVRIAAPAAAGDQFGGAIAALGLFDGDSVPDLAISAHTRDGTVSNGGAVWIVTLNPNGSQKTAVEISANTVPQLANFLDSNDRFGLGLAELPDLDGNGVDDLLTSAFRDDDTAPDAGALYVIFMESTGLPSNIEKLSSRFGAFALPLNPGDGLGIGASYMGDLLGDGTAEIAVTAFFDDAQFGDSGAVYIMSLGDTAGVCGNATLEPMEECDDGNIMAGDGCSSFCTFEFCGDGDLQPLLGEECDDANMQSGDGCSANCRIEVCGDTIVQPSLGEECDDGGVSPNDGCDATCQNEWVLMVSGDPEGGQVDFTVMGLPLSVATLDIQTVNQVVASIVFEINNNATLASLGVTATQVGDTLYTNSDLTNVSTTDPGLSLILMLGPPPSVPVPSWIALPLTLTLLVGGTLAARRRSNSVRASKRHR